MRDSFRIKSDFKLWFLFDRFSDGLDQTAFSVITLNIRQRYFSRLPKLIFCVRGLIVREVIHISPGMFPRRLRSR